MIPFIVYMAWFRIRDDTPEVVELTVAKAGPNTITLARGQNLGPASYRRQIPREEVSFTPREAMKKLLKEHAKAADSARAALVYELDRLSLVNAALAKLDGGAL